jgi:hypothetical protein
MRIKAFQWAKSHLFLLNDNYNYGGNGPMKRIIHKVLAGVFIACLCSIPAFAALTGDISGTVTDASGAVVVGAKVTIKSLSTGTMRETVTSDVGQFSVAQLEIGGYEVAIEKSGFKTYKGTTTVRSGENSRLAAKLEIGSADSIVTVEATVATLDVATAQISNSLDAREVQALPNQVRDPVAYATLSPGTVPVTKDNPFLGTGSFNSNGSRGRANNITVDGIISSDISTTGEAGTGTFSYDGVQEFKLISNNFDAEFGRNSGSQVQIITKSGGNQFHGSAYIFHQNNYFNARDYFNNTDPNGDPGPGRVNHFVQNQGGFTAGGPIWKDHTFLFGHFEIDKTRGSSGSVVAAVPTPDDVAAITDPTSLALFNRYGAPASASGTISNPAPNVDDGHSWSVRLDQNLHGGRDSFFIRYGKNPDISASPGLTFINTNLAGFGAQFSGQGVNLSSGYTMSPASNIVNQLRFGFARIAANFVANTPFPSGPQIAFNDGTSGLGVSNIIPQGRTQKTLQYGDTLSWVHGRHTFKFGTDVVNYNTPSFFDSNINGTLTFNTFGDFQAGTPLSFTQRFAQTTFRVNKALDVFGFVQDDFRLTSALTLNLGFRIESSGGVSEENNIISNVNPNNTAPLGVRGTGPLGGIDVGGEAFHRNWNPAPRVGLAWNPGRGNLVIRGGYGIAYDYIFLNPITNLRFAAPFVYSITQQTFTGGDSYANIVAGTSNAQATARSAVGGFPPSFVNFGSISAVDQNLQNPRNQQWSAGVEYQALRPLTLKATYVGTRNDRLQVSMPLNFTDPALRPAAAVNVADQEARLASFRSFVNAESPTSATATNNRIDPRFNTVTQVQSIGSSNYNALQLEALGKFKDLSFNANYTWSHSIDDVSDVLGVLVNDSASIGSPNLPLEFNRANSQFDLRHRFNLSYSYRVPFARSLSSGLLKNILDGWTISNIFSLQGGFPVTLFAGAIRVRNTASPLCNTPKGCAIQTVSDSQLLGTGITWLNGDPNLVHPSAFSSSVATASVSQPLVGHQGNSGRNHLRLDGLSNLDAALGKSFKITEGRNLQLRWEVFNVLNHPNLSGFVNTFNVTGSFGTYQSTATNMRQMQVAARFQF